MKDILKQQEKAGFSYFLIILFGIIAIPVNFLGLLGNLFVPETKTSFYILLIILSYFEIQGAIYLSKNLFKGSLISLILGIGQIIIGFNLVAEFKKVNLSFGLIVFCAGLIGLYRYKKIIS